MIFVLSSCSDDTQETPDWREELYPSYRPVWVGEGLPPVGDNFERFGPGINIKNSKGTDLLYSGHAENVLGSDFYFEYQGKRYCVGDTLDFMPESFRVKQKTVKIIPQISGAPYTLYLFMAYPHMGSVIDELTEPIDITYSFVWPSKGIRKSFRVYCEKNVDLLQDIEAATTDENGFKKAELFRYGMWENGVSTKGEQVITITVDRNSPATRF